MSELRNTRQPQRNLLRRLASRIAFAGVDPEEAYSELTRKLWDPQGAGRNIDQAMRTGLSNLTGTDMGGEGPGIMELFGEHGAPRNALEIALSALPEIGPVMKGLRGLREPEMAAAGRAMNLMGDRAANVSSRAAGLEAASPGIYARKKLTRESIERSRNLVRERTGGQIPNEDNLVPYTEYQGATPSSGARRRNIPNEDELVPYESYQGNNLSTGEGFEDLQPLPKLGAEAGEVRIPGKHDRARALIEKAGGKNIQYNAKTNKIRWTKGKDTFEADLNERFGPRNVGLSRRQQGTSDRQLGTNERSPLAKALKGEDPATGRGYSKESQAKIDEALGKENTTFPDPEDPDTESLHSGLPPIRIKHKVQRSRAIPENLKLKGSYKLDSAYNGTPLNFADPFDQMAYTLANKNNYAMMRELTKKFAEHSGITEDAAEKMISEHGQKLKGIIEENIKAQAGGKAKKAFDVPARPLIEEVPKEATNWFKEAVVAPSQTVFAVDLPLLRQSFRPTILHPFKSGIPAIKNAFKSVTQKGFDQVVEDLARNSPVYKRLEQSHALPSATEALYPNINELHKLPTSDLGAYYTESAPMENIPLLGDLLLKPSRRMFEAAQKTVRGKEVERLAEKVPGGLDALLSGGDAEAKELRNIVNRVADETGHGTLGERGDRALGFLSGAFTAPRNTAAKFQFYNPLNYFPEGAVNAAKLGRFRRDIGSGVAYKDFLADQAKLLGGTAAGLYGAEKAGADVDMNPYSANFGVRFGNYKPDLFGGELGIVREMARLNPFHTERVSGRGQEYEANPISDTLRFMRGRLRPGLPSMGVDFFNKDPDTEARTNYFGEDIEKPYVEGDKEGDILRALTLNSGVMDKPYSRWIAQNILPAYPRDVANASEEGTGTGLAAAGLGILGSGSSTYDPFAFQPYKPPKLVIKVKRRHPGEYEQKKAKKPGESAQRFF